MKDIKEEQLLRIQKPIKNLRYEDMELIIHAKWNEEFIKECGEYNPVMREYEDLSYTKVTCSNCGKKPPAYTMFPYCPYCGAKMDLK